MRMFLPNWIRGGVEGKVYVEQGSVPVFIRGEEGVAKWAWRPACLFTLERRPLVGSPVALEMKDSCLADRGNDEPAAKKKLCMPKHTVFS